MTLFAKVIPSEATSNLWPHSVSVWVGTVISADQGPVVPGLALEFNWSMGQRLMNCSWTLTNVHQSPLLLPWWIKPLMTRRCSLQESTSTHVIFVELWRCQDVYAAIGLLKKWMLNWLTVLLGLQQNSYLSNDWLLIESNLIISTTLFHDWSVSNYSSNRLRNRLLASTFNWLFVLFIVVFNAACVFLLHDSG